MARGIEENGKILQSARWKLKTGCLLKEGSIRKAWMRMLGLPLHMWSWEEFMKIGNCCRGFVAVDEDTTYSSYLQWARILVKLDLRALASLFQVVVGSSTFSLQLWWETPLRFLKKVLRSYSSGTSNLEVRDRRKRVGEVATGCLLKEGSIRKAWMRMLGLPLHMWSWEEFMKIGNCCRGFVAVDEDTTYSSYLQWARILVKLDLRALASLFQVVVGSSTFSLQLWWETPLRFLKKVLRSYSSGTSNLEIGERGLVRLQLSAFLGVLIFWDNRMLDLIGMKVGEFSISYQFKNWDDDSCSVFSESYNKEVFGNVTSKKELALNYVVFWDSKEGTRLLTMKERDARQLAREEFKKWVLLEKTFWRQKSREIRLKEGDDEVVLPEVSFSEVEVFKTLSNLNGDKAPCPNGFSIKFRQFSWDFVNDEVMGFFRDFHEQDKFVKSLNASFLVLISKKGGV
ncbi:hypothetical protein CK203_081323 [Vitis vinifera]|uniref:DUF4283 domain-containing protein n=1 Tax=Vitis vinifera TaxID=29760 RepID=A0A438CZN7_VITVI|nr:hypothetical protein CK203_081323 [Vitis vinifera]